MGAGYTSPTPRESLKPCRHYISLFPCSLYPAPYLLFSTKSPLIYFLSHILLMHGYHHSTTVQRVLNLFNLCLLDLPPLGYIFLYVRLSSLIEEYYRIYSYVPIAVLNSSPGCLSHLFHAHLKVASLKITLILCPQCPATMLTLSSLYILHI